MRLLVFTVFFLSVLIARVSAQVASGIEDAFRQYRVDNLQEKLYVHTDREFYLCGEIVWFKLYCHNGVDHKPLEMSKVAYIEIVDVDNKPVLQAKVELLKGMGSGSLFIPTTIDAGKYRLRAYTRWMMNFDPEFYFHKEITIVNSFRRLSTAPVENMTKPDVQFFPEGGSLVNGLKSKVAFRGVMPDGRGFHFRGSVVNASGDTLVRFEPEKFGMGQFYFTPQKEQRYQVVIVNDDGREYSYLLPEATDRGVVMHLSEHGGVIEIGIESKEFSSAELWIFVHVRNRIVSSERVSFNAEKTVFKIDKQAFGEGVNHITVFDRHMNPLCERLYFKRPPDRLTIKADLPDEEYQTREKITVGLESRDATGAAVAANLSVSVYQIDSLNDVPGIDIQSYLWLVSDLSGRVESPQYYFADTASAPNADILMLTHGWRRFTWPDVLKKSKPAKPYLPEVRGHLLDAKVTEKQSGQPASNLYALLSSPGKFVNATVARSDSSGVMVFETPNLYGPGEVFIQTPDPTDSLYFFEVLSPFSEQYSAAPLQELSVSAGLRNTILQRSIHMQSQNVYREEELNRFMERKDSMSFFHHADKTYRLDDYTRFTTMEDVMREYVPEVWVRQRKKSFYFRMLDSQRELLFEDDNPMIFFDGIPVFDVDKVMAVDPLKVEKIEIITRRYFVGPLTFNGVVSYTTYNGNLDGFTMDDDTYMVSYDGLQLHREFYQPRYEMQELRSSRTPDFRNLLFWSPQVVADNEGKATLEFHTSDLAGDFLIVVEGASKEGLVGSKTFTFSVGKEAK